jgi:hypothetical protein
MCNGQDDDCNPGTPDGQDEPGYWTPCDGPDTDLCEEGYLTICDAGSGQMTCDDFTGDNQEVCNGQDDDCDGSTDPPGSPGCSVYYQDADGDGFGDPDQASACICAPEDPYTVDNGEDCDDTNAAIHPEAHEGIEADTGCGDGIDNDCDGITDMEDPCCGTGPGWWDNAWSRRRRIDFLDTGSSTHLEDAPVLVVLDPNRIDYALAGPAGESLRFVDGDCSTLLAHEVESFVSGDVSHLWVRVPRIARSDMTDFIWMYYGNPGASDAQNPPDVWRGGSQAVFHLDGSANDSSAGAFHGTPLGTTTVPGHVAQGMGFDGISAHVDLGLDLDLLRAVRGATLSAWFQRASMASFHHILALSIGTSSTTDESRASFGLSDIDLPWAIGRSADSDEMQRVEAPGSVVGTGTWHHLVTVIDYSYNDITLYLDGVEVTRQTVGFTQWTTADTPTHLNNLGTQDDAASGFFDGILDEIRVAARARSADWVLTQYLSTTDGLLVFNTEETW